MILKSLSVGINSTWDLFVIIDASLKNYSNISIFRLNELVPANANKIQLHILG